MALTCPANFDTARLGAAVRETYERVAANPHGDFHFHRGADYAARALGYDQAELALVPALSTDAFAGVGNPHRAGALHQGETVLDHACGAGMDLLLAARRVGPRGRAIGVDMTRGMLDRGRRAAKLAGLDDRTAWREGVYQALPVETASVDVVLSNGVLNLAPDKRAVMREVARVLRPGGRLMLSDVVVQRELTLAARSDPELWAACIAGALPEAELFDVCAEVGLGGGRIVAHYDAFGGTSADGKVSRDLRVQGVTFFAEKRA
jgi:arsenite methyltransferase